MSKNQNESEGDFYFDGLSFLTFLALDILIISLFDIFTFGHSRENLTNIINRYI
jgi:hypothetical protein